MARRSRRTLLQAAGRAQLLRIRCVHHKAWPAARRTAPAAARPQLGGGWLRGLCRRMPAVWRRPLPAHSPRDRCHSPAPTGTCCCAVQRVLPQRAAAPCRGSCRMLTHPAAPHQPPKPLSAAQPVPAAAGAATRRLLAATTQCLSSWRCCWCCWPVCSSLAIGAAAARPHRVGARGRPPPPLPLLLLPGCLPAVHAVPLGH